MAQQATSPQARLGLLAELARSARLVWRLFRDPRVATATKVIVPGLIGAYLLWPADLLPDLVPALGQLDDLALLALGIRLFVELCPPAIVQQHREALANRRGAPPPVSKPDGEVVDAEYRIIE